MPAGCSWGGLGTMGCTTITSAAGSSTASVAWLVADYLNPNDQGVEMAAHEGGHNMGLNHSESRGFGSTTPLGGLGVGGSINEYGDYFSPMGYYNLGHYAAQQKYQLGWLSSSNVQTVQSSGSFTLNPFEWNTAGLQALKVQRGTGINDWLWLEYRQPFGNYDTTLSPQVFGGPTIRYVDSITGTYTNLLNFTPSDSSWRNPALTSGQSWVDPYTNVSLAVSGATSNGVTVNVNYNAPTCTSANPIVVSSPANPSVTPGTPANYSVTISNADSAGCSPSTFSMSSSQPSGWSSSLSSTTISLNPGASTIVNLTEVPPMGTLPGTYAVAAIAARGAQSVMGPANCSVLGTPPPISVALSLNGSTFQTRSMVSNTATVTAGTTMIAGAAVTFNMTKPDGSTASGTGTTSNGQVVWSYKIGPKDPSGTYTVKSTAVYKTQTAITATTFNVQ